jgi:hypothetical protein
MRTAVSLNNVTDQIVYNVPTGKRATIFVDIWPVSTNPSTTIKVNDIIYFTGTLTEDISLKLILDAGDNIKITVTGQINVFVHGLEF